MKGFVPHGKSAGAAARTVEGLPNAAAAVTARADVPEKKSRRERCFDMVCLRNGRVYFLPRMEHGFTRIRWISADKMDIFYLLQFMVINKKPEPGFS
jgi:hypothetical protein